MAAKENKSAIAVDSGWCDMLFFKGYALDDQGRLAEGVTWLEKAVAKAPMHAHYLNELGYAYQQLRDWPKSIDAYKRADEAAAFAGDEEKAERTRAWRGQGYDLVEMGRLDDAEAMYRECLKLDPHDQKATGELAYIQQQRAKLLNAKIEGK